MAAQHSQRLALPPPRPARSRRQRSKIDYKDVKLLQLYFRARKIVPSVSRPFHKSNVNSPVPQARAVRRPSYVISQARKGD